MVTHHRPTPKSFASFSHHGRTFCETVKVNMNGQTIENDAFDETKKWASNLIDQITRSDNPSTVTLVQVS